MRARAREHYWESRPLCDEIVDVLRSKGGVASTEALFDTISRMRPSLSFKEFMKALMSLEIEGLVVVYRGKRGRLEVRFSEGVRGFGR